MKIFTLKAIGFLLFFLGIVTTAKSQACDDFVITLDTSSVVCIGDANREVLAQVNGGTAPYLFTLQGGGNNVVVVSPPVQSETFIFKNLFPGEYIVEVTDANFCFEIQTIVIEELLAIEITTTISNGLCFGSEDGSILTQVSEGTSPYWYNLLDASGTQIASTTSNVFENLPAGDYIVEVAYSSGNCTYKSAIISITEPEPLVLDVIIQDISCSGEGTIIDAIASGGIPPYIYSLIDATGVQIAPPTTSSTFEGLPGGDYIIEVTDANSCSEILTITVEEPLITTTISTVLCFGDADGSILTQVSGSVPPYWYTLLDASGIQIVPRTTSNVFENLPAGNYIVEVAYSAGNCTYNSAIISITEPEPLALDVIVRDIFCSGEGAIEVIASGGAPPYIYSLVDDATGVQIAPPTTSSTFEGLPGGVYNVLAEDSNGCTYIQNIEISDQEIIEFSIDVDYVSVSENSIEVSGTGGTPPYVYRIIQNSTEIYGNLSGIFNAPEGEYSIVIRDSNSCELIQNVLISYDDIDNDGISDNDEDVNGNGNLDDDDTDGDGIPDYLDDDDDNDGVNSSGEINTSGKSIQKMAGENFLDTNDDGVPNHRDMDDDGDGILTIDEDFNGNGDPTDDDTDNSGIPDYLEKEIAVLSIQENELTDNFSFFPNPAASNLVLEFNDLKGELLEVSFFDINGTKILTKKEVNMNQSLAIDVSSFSTGIYFVQIRNGDRFGVKKLSVR